MTRFLTWGTLLGVCVTGGPLIWWAIVYRPAWALAPLGMTAAFMILSERALK